MASIDKTYVSKEEYIQARQFWIDTYDKQIKELGGTQYLYSFGNNTYPDSPTPEFLKENTKDIDTFVDDSVLWNTGSVFDMWLAKNCNLDFIQSTLKYQYGEDWIGFKFKEQLDFTDKPILVSIHSKNNDISLDFFRTKGDDLKENEVYFHDKIIFYGSTFILEVIHNAFRTLSGYVKELEVVFDYYGVEIVCKDGKFYHYKDDNVEINLGYIRKEEFILPEIKHSYSLEEAKNYKDDEIFISRHNQAYNIDMYKDFSRDKIKRYLRDLPEYIYEIITE